MENIIFKAPSEQKLHDFGIELLTKIPKIKLAPKERILCVQRQHWLFLVQRMLLPIFAISIVFFTIFFLVPQNLLATLPRFYIIQLNLILVLISTVLLLEVYIFMDWYYQFYIITTRCLLYMHFFRIGGYYFDEVFLDQIRQQEFSRRAPNVIYDLFGLYDVYVYFSHIDRPEPFIFHIPSDSSKIEDILEDITVQEIEKKEKGR